VEALANTPWRAAGACHARFESIIHNFELRLRSALDFVLSKQSKRVWGWSPYLGRKCLRPKRLAERRGWRPRGCMVRKEGLAALRLARCCALLSACVVVGEVRSGGEKKWSSAGGEKRREGPGHCAISGSRQPCGPTCVREAG
jgi:hypothetical protein